ncbi:Exodeoxyribonuclease 7 large subunit [anaerobic digester metagenome]
MRNIERVGLGKILLDLEMLKEKLKAQGMFDRSRDIPLYPAKIGIITSKSGAAIKDILKTFETVKSSFEVVVYNVLVQGEKSKENIISGIKYFNDTKADVILISRGGGSFEDLNVFNDLKVAEEVYKSDVPVVTGIGHETDRTLTDYVADVYCHTPTAAAERIITGYKDIEDRLKRLASSLKQGTYNMLKLKAADLKSSKYIMKSYLPVENLYKLKMELESYNNIMKNSAVRRLKDLNFELNILHEKLSVHNYLNKLEKGFAMVSDEKGNVIKNIDQVVINGVINLRFKDFKVQAETLHVQEVQNEG